MANEDRPRVAVIVPVFDEAERIGRLLKSLVVMNFGEIIVTDGGSSDGTADIARGTPGVTVVEEHGGRGGQINAAVRVAHAPMLVILHADTKLPDNAPALIDAALSDPKVSGGCFRLSFDDDSVVLRFSAWLTRFETGFTSFGDQAFFCRRSDFVAMGGAPDWPFMEDVELRRRLLRQGRFIKLKQSVTTSARRFQMRGALRGQLRNASILLAFRLGVSPHRLARFYGVRNH